MFLLFVYYNCSKKEHSLQILNILKIKDIKFDEIEIFHDKPQCAAYFENGDFEVYFDGMTFKKHCTKTVAKKICEQFGIEWELTKRNYFLVPHDEV